MQISPHGTSAERGLAEALVDSRVAGPTPEQISAARIVLLGRSLLQFWRIHAAVMAVLYVLWLLLGLRIGDMDFVVTGRSSKNMWLSIICSQGLVWMHTINVAGTAAALVLIGRRAQEAEHMGRMAEAIVRCRKDLLVILASSLSFYSIMACYREHNDSSTLGICPVVLVVVLSHLTCLLMKVNFFRNMGALRGHFEEDRRREPAAE